MSRKIENLFQNYHKLTFIVYFPFLIVFPFGLKLWLELELKFKFKFLGDGESIILCLLEGLFFFLTNDFLDSWMKSLENLYEWWLKFP